MANRPEDLPQRRRSLSRSSSFGRGRVKRRPRQDPLRQDPPKKRPSRRMIGGSRAAEEKRNVHVGSMDVTIFFVVTILVLIGVIMVFSASYTMAANFARFNFDPFYFLRRNTILAIGGLIIMITLSNISYEVFRPTAWIIYLVALGLSIAVIFIGIMTGGAQRWIPFPIIEQFQPSEIAKIALIFFMAFLVEKFPRVLHTWSGLFAFAAVIGALALPTLYGGFSATLIVTSIGIAMIFVASPHFWRFVAIGGGFIAVVGLYLLWDFNIGGGFRGARMGVWMDPFSDPLGLGFQIIQSLYAIAGGGWFGEGIGQSRQATFLPAPHHDIIFAIIVEELGFIGAGMVLLLYGILIWRGLIVALNAPDTFSSMVAFGVVFAIAFQTIINVAVATNTIPNTGVTLPFISYGGTSLFVSMGMAGILLSISRYTKEQVDL